MDIVELYFIFQLKNLIRKVQKEFIRSDKIFINFKICFVCNT